MKKILKAIAIAACTAELSSSVPTEILLAPVGKFRARDGRPHEVDAFMIDAAAAAGVIAKAEAAVGDFVIDYEHQTLHAEDNGQPAPAAGWFKKLEWREGEGLVAVDVRWTDKARALIESGEYRYISPVLTYNKNTGVVLAVPMAALTNYPALDGHSDLAARAAAKFQTNINEEDTVDREKLIALLGLADDASDDQIKKAMTALKAKAGSADDKDEEITALKSTHESEIASLKKNGGKPDPAKYVPVEAFESLKTEVASLRGEQVSTAVAALVSKGLDDGKLLPVQEDWAKDLGGKDIEALKSYLDKTPAIEALKGGTQSGGKAPEGGDHAALSAETKEIAAMLGNTEEDIQKHGA